jgi:hypothetical protein
MNETPETPSRKLTPTERELLQDAVVPDEPRNPLDLPKIDASEEEVDAFLDAIGGDSAHTARTSARPVIYAWQMLTEAEEWNIIGMSMTPGGPPLPLITTDVNMAWEAIDVAQAHANRANTRCRLAAYVYDTDLAIVDPEP